MNADPATPPAVLIVEAEPRLSRVLGAHLVSAGFTQSHLANSDGLVAFAREHRPALVVLDVNVPGQQPVAEVLRSLRTLSSAPILAVTTKVEEIDRLLALDLDIDDFLCQPCGPRELVTRVKSLLRVRNPTIPSTLIGVVPVFDVDDEAKQIEFRGKALDLTTSEFRVLRQLVRHPRRTHSRPRLLAELKGNDDAVFERVIDGHIRNIQKKLEKVEPGVEAIRSVYGVGYQLDVD